MANPTWYENLGLTYGDLMLPVIVGVLVIMVAAGGILGKIGWYGMILLGLYAIVAWYDIKSKKGAHK